MSRAGATVKLSVCALVALTLDLSGAAALSVVVGPQPDGTGVTPEGWRLTPAGSQTNLGNDPLDLAVSPDGSLAIVANAGYQNQSLMVVNTATGTLTETIPAQTNSVRDGPSTTSTAPGGPEHFYFAGGAHGYYVGLAFSPDGTMAYASDGPGDGIHTFRVSGGTLSEGQEIQMSNGAWPAGMTSSADGSRLYVAANLADSLAVIDTGSRKVLSAVRVGHLPYGVAVDRSGTYIYVTNWGGNTLTVLNAATLAPVVTLATGLHPSAMALNPANSELYVANTDSDAVTVIDTRSNTVLRNIDLRPYAGAPVGASPDGLSVSADGATLYAANAGDNDVAVIQLGPAGSTSGLDRVLGLIPTGWYPAGLVARSSTLYVVNMYGIGVGPIAPGQYIGSMVLGTFSRIPLPSSTQLTNDTAQVSANDRFGILSAGTKGNPVPATVGGSSPI